MLTPRGKLSLLALAPCLAFLAFTSQEGRAQEGKAVPTDVRVVNPNTAPVFASVVNTASAPVQAKIVNALGTPVPANIINPATAPVQAKIVNGPASPVQTSLVGSPVVGAKQSGVWNVTVANPRTAPVPTFDARDGQTPFQIGLTADASAFTVPTGKRLVIECMGLRGYGPNGAILYDLALGTTTSEVTVYHNIGYANVGTADSNTFYQGSNSTRIYADAGTEVRLYFTWYGGDRPVVKVSISGYLLPSP